MSLADLVAHATDKERFHTLENYIAFCSKYLEFVETGLQARIVSQDALRAGAGQQELAARILTAVAQKEAGHRINEPDFIPPSRTMSCIGG